jgi:hypothetical protein
MLTLTSFHECIRGSGKNCGFVNRWALRHKCAQQRGVTQLANIAGIATRQAMHFEECIG